MALFQNKIWIFTSYGKITKLEAKSGVDVCKSNKISYKSKLIESLCVELSEITRSDSLFLVQVASPEGTLSDTAPQCVPEGLDTRPGETVQFPPARRSLWVMLHQRRKMTSPAGSLLILFPVNLLCRKLWSIMQLVCTLSGNMRTPP